MFRKNLTQVKVGGVIMVVKMIDLGILWKHVRDVLRNSYSIKNAVK